GPFITEWCGNISPGSNLFTTYGLPQVSQYHVSMLSNGNYSGDISLFTQSEINSFIQANKTAGFRYVLNNATLPGTLNPGARFTLSSSWSNVNVAPTYDTWNVVYELKNSSGAIPWSFISTVNLKSLLGAGDPSSTQSI